MLRSVREGALSRLSLPDPAALCDMLRGLLHFILLGAAAYLLCRARFALRLAPLGMALLAAGLAAGVDMAALLAGCLLAGWNGSLARFGYDLAMPVGAAVVLLGGLIWNAAAPFLRRITAGWRRAPQARSPNLAPCVLAGLAVLLPGLALPALAPWGTGGLQEDMMSAGGALATGQMLMAGQTLAASVGAAAAVPFLQAALEMKRGRRCLLPEERWGLMLAGAGLCAGLYAIFPPAALLPAAMLALLLYPAGAAAGIGIGAALALVSGDFRPVAALGLCGATARLCAHSSRQMRALAGAAMGSGAAALAGMPMMCVSAIVVSGPAQLLIKAEWSARAARWAGDAGEGVDAAQLVSMANGRSAARLYAMAAAFGELAEGFMGQGRLPDEQALMTRLRENLCAGCPAYEACWAGDSNAGARLLCDLVALAVAQARDGADEPLFDGGVPGDISRRCRRARAIPDRLGDDLEAYAAARAAMLRRGGEDRLVSAQFLQARQLLEGMASDQARPVRLRDAQARRAAAVLERAGLEVADAVMLGGARPELAVVLSEGRWTGPMAESAAGLLSRAFGRAYAPAACGDRTLRLRREPRLSAGIGAACVSREAGLPSGDSHTTVMLEGGRLAAVLSDGMGSGAEAAGESAQTVRLLGKFLAAGADWSLAVEAANALMLNRAGEDMFATVDLLLLDLETGMAEFVKLAACPAFIARNGEVLRVEGGRLPLGILERVTPAAARVRLMPGDVVLLATDGVLDAVAPGELEALLIDANDDMDALAERVVALADGVDGAHRDDMTAVCVHLAERAA